MNRSKYDDQMEKAVEDFLKNWQVSVPIILGLLAFLLWKFWDKIAPEIPVTQIMAIGSEALRLVVMAGAGVLIIAVIRSIFVFQYNKKRFEYLQILPHADDEINPATLGELIRRLHGSKRGQLRRLLIGKEWFSFMIHYRKNERKGKQYVFYIGAPKDRIGSIKHHMSALYAKAEFYPADDIQFPKSGAAAGRLTMRRKKQQSTLSLARYKKDQLPGILAMMEPGSWMQLAFSADSEYRLKRRIIEAEKAVKKGKGYRERSAFDREEEKSFKTRFYGNEVSFHVTLTVASESFRKWGVIKDAGNAIAAVMADVNELRIRRFPGSLHRFPLPQPYQMVWTGSELATIFHLPELGGTGIAERIAEEIPHGTAGTQRLPKNVLAAPDGYDFGELLHPLIEGRSVRILPQALGKQWGLTGKTGSGKSTVLNTIFKSFIDFSIENKKSPGFSFIDPKKETATITLNQLLKREQEGAVIDWSKVHWISFKGANNPPAMNLLYKMPGVPDNVLVDQIMRIIRENNFGVAPQAERLLKKCIQTLLADQKGNHTILGVRPLLLRDSFRRAVLARLKQDPKNTDLIQFWEDEADDLMRISGTAILNRLDVFYSNDFLRRIFGQTGFNFPLRQWMDEGHMVFYDFSGMGEEEIGLIGSYLSYLYYRVADTRPDRSLMHQFVIDEAQRVKASILPEIHAEMRSKGLSLGISTQTMEKLEPGLQKSLVNIVGNMFVCGQGQSGAKVAADIFKAPKADGKDITLYSEGYLMNLPPRTCVIKTEDIVNGREQTVFAVVTVPPLDRYLPDGSLAAFNKPAEIEKSNAWTFAKAKELEGKNGQPVEEVDRMIQDYLNEEAVEDAVLVKPKKAEPKKMAAPKETKVVEPEEVSLFDLKGE